MSRLSKAVRKASRSIKKHLGSHWYLPGYAAVKGVAEMGKGAYDEYKANEGLYNRLALTIAGSMITGGALGAAMGAAGMGGTTVGSALTSGALSGAVAGTTAGAAGAYQEHQMDKAIEEQERAAKEAASEQARLAQMQAGATPEELSSLDFTISSRSQSQFKRNIKSRQAGKTVGGSSSTLA